MPFSAPTVRRFAIAALLCAATLAGCEDSKVVGLGPVAENDDSDFREGRRLAQEGKEREALDLFTKVILSRREAPESHLEAGNLCLGAQVKDPLRAIFHFRQFLAQRPASIHTQVVQDRIRASEKAFLKTLPFSALDGSADDRVAGLQEQLRLVRAENDQLKIKVSAALASRFAGAATPTAPSGGESDEAEAPAPATLSPTARPTLAVAPAPSAATAKATEKKPAGTRRSHVIAKGDNLAAISRKYYGTPARWKDILNANRAVMKSERDLKIGREIVIPE